MESNETLKRASKIKKDSSNEENKNAGNHDERKEMNIDVGKKISKTLILQVWSKLLSFVFNVLAARHASKDVYGYSNVTLQFYYTFILFFMKECVRKALQKEISMNKYSDKQRLRGALNIVTKLFWWFYFIILKILG